MGHYNDTIKQGKMSYNFSLFITNSRVFDTVKEHILASGSKKHKKFQI